jgi:putative ABC transport system ATP-binding protein
MAVIELKNISKEYRNDAVVTAALSEVNLCIETGEFVAIMGASGSGKTTLLNLIGCMDMPTAGTYLFDGMDVGRMKESQRASIRGRRIAFVFQNFALIEADTVFENVELPLLKRPISRAERKQRVMTALTAVGISELAKKRPSHISGGQKQRTAIARAIACGADIILADEPTGALDSRTGKEILELFTQLNAQGKTIVLITHDRQIAAYAKRLIIIQDGRIACSRSKSCRPASQ